MSALPITIVGQLTGKDGSENVTINGLATITGLEVGGGPVQPPYYPAHPIAPGGEHPAHPIAPGGPPPRPAHPIYLPPGIWPDPPEGSYTPEHPIVIPPPSVIDGSPPIEVQIGWTPGKGWFIYYVPTGDHVTPSA